MKTKVQQFAEGVGVRKFWGFSPAIDLLTLPHASTPSQASSPAPPYPEIPNPQDCISPKPPPSITPTKGTKGI